MRGTIATTIMMATLLLFSQDTLGRAQQQSAPVAPPVQNQSAAKNTSATDDNRTSKQRALDDEANRLVAMANELKVAVDKTNKNILSLDVVRKAEEIEQLAHRMKDQSKR